LLRVMISALQTSGGFLAVPVALATAGWSDLALLWLLGLQHPLYFILVVVSLVLLCIAGLIQLKPLSFVSFGLVPACVFLFVGIWTAPFGVNVDLILVAKASLMAVSTFIPFALVQFLLALFVSPRGSSSEEPT
jgi:hypothetical protein